MYSRPSSYPYPSSFKNIKDVEEYQKKLYASLMENDRAGEFYRDRATDADLKALVFRPEWYGPDGTADDKTRVQAALTAAAVNGGVVVLSPKNYVIKSGLTYGSNVSIVGCGDESIIEVYNGAAGFTALSPSAAGVSDVIFHNFQIDSSGDHLAATSSIPCVSVDKTARVTIDGVKFANVDTMAVWADSPVATPTSGLVIKNCKVINSDSGGFSLFGTVTDFDISNNYITGCGDDAIAIQEGTATGQPTRGVISGNRILDCVTRGGAGADATANGVLIYGGTHISIVGNEIDGVVGCGIRVQYSPSYPSQYITIVGNSITDTGRQVGDMTGVPTHGIYVLESNNVTVSGNTVHDTYGHGIFIHDSGLTDPEDAVTGNISVSGNTVTLGHSSGIYFLDIKDSTITGNTCMDNGITATQYGILINATDSTHFCEDIVITGNRCGDTKAYGSKTQLYGLAIIGSTNRNIQITGNNFEGNATASITSATASPNALFWNNITSVRTAVKTAAILGATQLYIDSTTLMSVGDIIRVTLDDTTIQETTIKSILDTDLVVLTAALTDSAAEDNVVDAIGWKLYLPIHNTLKWSFDAPVEIAGNYSNDFRMTSPTTVGAVPTDGFQMWSYDIVAGNAAPHFRTEAGDIVKLYKQVLAADLKEDYTTGDLDSEAEVIAAVNATNAKINDLITALINTGLLAAA